MSQKNHILQSTLEQLERDNWDEPNFDSQLVKRTHALRKIPLARFNTEDLRLMIGQKLSFKYLMPLALNILAENILAEGDYYPGDLLQNVLKVDAQFWTDNPNEWTKLDQLLKLYQEALAENNIDTSGFYNNQQRKK